jgi:hypothetical protein
METLPSSAAFSTLDGQPDKSEHHVRCSSYITVLETVYGESGISILESQT